MRLHRAPCGCLTPPVGWRACCRHAWFATARQPRWLQVHAHADALFIQLLLRLLSGIQKVLGGTAQPGMRGMLKDVLRIIWGAWLLARLGVARSQLKGQLRWLPGPPALTFSTGLTG